MEQSCNNCLVYVRCKIRLVTFISISNDLNESVLTAYHSYLKDCPVFCCNLNEKEPCDAVVNNICEMFDLDPKDHRQ